MRSRRTERWAGGRGPAPGQSHRHAAGGRSAFTLLELVLVMVIIGTLLGAAAPSLRGFFVSRQTDRTAAQLVSFTRLARSQAIADGRVYRLNVDPVERTCYLTRRGRGGYERIAASLAVPLKLAQEIEVEITGSPGGGSVGFYPDGRADPAVIRVTDIKGGILEVVCPGPTEPFSVMSPEEGR